MTDEARDNHAQQIERAEIANLVRSRMESLNLPTVDYDDVSEKRNSLSYVIINPSCDLKLEEGDIMYVYKDAGCLGKNLVSTCFLQLSRPTVAVLRAENVRAPQLAPQVEYLVLLESEYGSGSSGGRLPARQRLQSVGGRRVRRRRRVWTAVPTLHRSAGHH